MDPERPRTEPTILAELAEVRRHLQEVPPHHGGGAREALTGRQRDLERELAAVRARLGRERRS